MAKIMNLLHGNNKTELTKIDDLTGNGYVNSIKKMQDNARDAFVNNAVNAAYLKNPLAFTPSVSTNENEVKELTPQTSVLINDVETAAPLPPSVSTNANEIPESPHLLRNAKAVSLLVNCLYLNDYLNDIVPNRAYFDSIAQNYSLENGETIYQSYTAINTGNIHRTPLKRKHIEVIIRILENDSRYPKALRTINMYLESIEPKKLK